MLANGVVIHRAAGLLLTAMAGSELCVAAFIQPIIRKLDEPTQRVVSPPFAGHLGNAMPFWYAASLFATGADWWIGRASMVAWSLGLQLLILAFTLGVMVPMNTRIARGQLEPGWLSMAQRWDRMHVLRAGLLLAASGLLLYAS